MSFIAGLINGMREIWAHKFRSFLSMIGIILGVAALVAMVGLVEGMLLGFRQFFEQNGGIRRIEISRETPPLEQEPIANRSPGMSMVDVEAIQHNLPSLDLIAPRISVGWERIQLNAVTQRTHVVGITPEFLPLNNYEIKAGGRTISALDIEQINSVVIIPEQLARRLFKPGVNPIGKSISIRGTPFTVIGVALSGKGKDWQKERRSMIPLTTAQYRLNLRNSMNEISLTIQNGKQLEGSVEMLRNILLQTHNGIEDFAIATQTEALAEFNNLERAFTFSLGGIAAITLMVGGVGILNVMLAVINERIREIGVRKAVGARGIDIFVQFIAEAIVISTLGGMIGIFVSVGLVEVLKQVIPPEAGTVVLSPRAMIVGFVFSVIVGMLSGIYPAFKAARLNVIDALRYE